MEMEEEEESSPFWVESSRRRHRGRRLSHGVSSFFLSSGLLVTLLLLTAIAFLGFVVPSTISLSSQIFRPNNVKKSWDSINLILVLFALIFGFLSRNMNQDRNVNEDGAQVSNPSTPRGWYGGGDHGGFPAATGNGGGGGLRRSINSSSYPDLLEASPKLSSGVDSWGSYDDMRIYSSRFSGEGLHRRRSWKYAFDGGDDTQMPEIENPFEDTFMGSPEKPPPVAHPSPPPSSPPAPPSPPPAVPAPPEYRRERRRKRSDPQIQLQDPISAPAVITPVAPPSPPPPGNKRERRRRKRMQNHIVRREPISEPVVTLTTPPPPLLAEQDVNREKGKSEKKRSGGNATKDFLNSLYHKKKKKQRQKSVENFDALFHQPQIPPLHYQLPPPSPPPPAPPPPPPPPPSVFHSIFSSKKSRRKTTGTVISVPIPPPQPFLRPKAAQIPTSATYAGGESPLRRIPPPPPPPPPPFLKSPAWRFVVQGDFVRVDSSVSSRSGSPELDEEMESNGTPTASDGGDTTPFPASPLFFPPSPDVNSKADNFINRFRAGLKLEKINSMNNRGVGRSNLGPG